MSHSRFHHKRCELTRAWLNLLTEHMTPGRINQISIVKPKTALGAVLNRYRFESTSDNVRLSKTTESIEQCKFASKPHETSE